MKRKTDQAVETHQQPLELKKHVAVIHSGNKLSLLQRKIANALLYNAYKDLMTKDEHEIHIGTLCKMIGYESNDHKTIKKSLVNLLSTVLQWNLVDGDRIDDDGIWSASSIIADASIDGAICTYSYSNKMKKLLYRPNMYGRLDMLVQAKFQSGYGLALYENCNRFQDVGKTPWFDLDKFRLLMGVQDGKYKIFRDFKTRVLDTAIEEVNKYSSIKIEPQFRRQNRQVIAIQFNIKKRDGNVIGLPQLIDDKSGINEILREKFGFSKKQIEEIISGYELNYIFEKIAIIENSKSYQSGKINNLGKYLISALADDYQPSKSSKELKKDNPDGEMKNSHKNKNELLFKYEQYQQNECLRLFCEISEDQKNLILKDFLKNIRGVYTSAYEREGLNHPLIQQQLAMYLLNIKSEIPGRVLDFDEWSKLFIMEN